MIGYDAARNELFEKLTSAWQSASRDVLGDSAELRYQGREEPDLPDAGAFWGRAGMMTVIQNQANVGQLNDGSARRYRTIGQTYVQVFAPKSVSGSFAKACSIASRIRNQFASSATQGRIIFRNGRIDDNPKTNDQWLMVTFWSEYQFDEII